MIFSVIVWRAIAAANRRLSVSRTYLRFLCARVAVTDVIESPARTSGQCRRDR